MNLYNHIHLRHLAVGFSLLVLSGCAAQNVVKSSSGDAPPATNELSGLTPENRVAFFVNHARSGECAEVAKSLAEGQDINQVDALGQTALIAAVSHNSLECVKVLLDHQANANIPDGSGWTPLIYAAYFGGSDELLGTLLSHGADINARNDRDVTALFLASASGHEEQVKFLLSHGADQSIQSKAGYTPLRIASLRGQGKIVSLLQPESASTPKSASKP